MLTIGKTYIERVDGISRLSARIRIGGKETVLWFGVKTEQEDALSIGRSDPFVFAFLPAAMRQDLTIVSEDPMSEKLHHTLTEDLIPALSGAGDLYHEIALNTPVTGVPYPAKNEVATGFSGGVDSLYSVFRHGKDSEYPLTTLCVFNNGVYEGEKYRLGFDRACRSCEKFAAENGYSTLFVDSNLYDVLEENYLEIATFRLVSCALAIQGAVSVYLLSSGFYISDFYIDPHHAACFDPLTIGCINTESLQFYLSGIDKKRVEKLREMTDWEPAGNWLCPCVYAKPGDVNCGKCKKCMKDLAALYAFGKMDAFKKVFDIADYKKNLPQRLGFVLSDEEDPFSRDVIELFEKEHTVIPPMAEKCAAMFRKAKTIQRKAEENNG